MDFNPLTNDIDDAAMRARAKAEYCDGEQWEKFVKIVNEEFSKDIGMSRLDVADFDISDYFDKEFSEEDMRSAAQDVISDWKYDRGL